MKPNQHSLRSLCGAIAGLVTAFGVAANGFTQETKKPNILVICGDDIGIWRAYWASPSPQRERGFGRS